MKLKQKTHHRAQIESGHYEYEEQDLFRVNPKSILFGHTHMK